MRHFTPLLALGLAVGACTPQADPSTTYFVSLDQIAGAAPATPAVTGLLGITLPVWVGKPKPPQRRQYANGWTQTVSFEAPDGRRGVGAVSLDILVDQAAATDALSVGRPTEGGIRTELSELFPGTTMNVVPRPAHNAYGPYGAAIGQSADGDHCLYAWQWLDADAASAVAHMPLRAAALRIRLCRPDISFDALAAAVDQLKLSKAVVVPAQAHARQKRRPSRIAAAANRQHRDEQSVRRDPTNIASTDPIPTQSFVTDLPAEALRGPKPAAARTAFTSQ